MTGGQNSGVHREIRGELRGKNTETDGGVGIVQSMCGIHTEHVRRYAEFTQNAFADLHSEKIGRALNRHGR